MIETIDATAVAATAVASTARSQIGAAALSTAFVVAVGGVASPLSAGVGVRCATVENPGDHDIRRERNEEHDGEGPGEVAGLGVVVDLAGGVGAFFGSDLSLEAFAR